jgi:integrase
MRAKITKTRVDALKAGDALADTEIKGFTARRLPSGVVTFGLRYRAAGKQRWFALGLHGRITPDQARELAKQRAGEVAAGGDPAGVVEQATKRVSLGSVVPAYLNEREDEFRAATLSEQKRYLQRYWKPLHDMPIGEVKRENVVTVIDAIAKEHGRVAADRARTSLSAFFTWAIDRGYCYATPVTSIKKRNKNDPRMRVLKESELVEVWNACLNDDYGKIVKLLILTGQRKSEIGDLAWPEIDTDKRQIEIPAQRCKNGRSMLKNGIGTHIVPLSDEALAILAEVEHRKDRDLLYGRGVDGFSGWSACKARLDKRIAEARKKAGVKKPMDPWTIHDLRRSCVTHLTESREDSETKSPWSFTQPHIVEAIVNHISGHKAGVAGVYNKAAYLSERRRALDLWGQHIAALIAGRERNVIHFPQAAERA